MTSNIPSSIFCLSLDFELHWGCFEANQLQTEQERMRFIRTRKVIPQLLELFREFEIHTTWATVGSLMVEHAEAWRAVCPENIPTYSNPTVSSYAWVEAHGFFDGQFHFAPELVEMIRQIPFQEIGTHTFSHYYCLEPGQTVAQFEADLRIAQSLAARYNVQMESLVFPRNQFRAEYLSVCSNVGIRSVRSSPDKWYWSPATGSTFFKRFFRAADAYFAYHPSQPILVRDLLKQSVLPYQLPSSRLYRPWKPRYRFQNYFKLQRILNEMTLAAKKKAYYHLWWHPHNLGDHPEECLAEIKSICAHYQELRKKYGMISMSMSEISTCIEAS